MEIPNSFDAKLVISTLNGDVEGVMAALAQGGRVTIKQAPHGFTPLLSAADDGYSEICGLLLAHSSGENEMLPNTKRTALHNAAVNGYAASVEALLSWPGVEVDLEDYAGVTPLAAACQEGHLACVSLLLKAGATKNGALPIH